MGSRAMSARGRSTGRRARYPSSCRRYRSRSLPEGAHSFTAPQAAGCDRGCAPDRVAGGARSCEPRLDRDASAAVGRRPAARLEDLQDVDVVRRIERVPPPRPQRIDRRRADRRSSSMCDRGLRRSANGPSPRDRPRSPPDPVVAEQIHRAFAAVELDRRTSVGPHGVARHHRRCRAARVPEQEVRRRRHRSRGCPRSPARSRSAIRGIGPPWRDPAGR